jgi:hypothetical protein
MPKPYDVGYKKPPKESQFIRGQSGNPKGRPKGSKNISTMFNQITNELIQVTENGRSKSMTRMEAVIHQLTNKALSGDPRVMREFLHLGRMFEEVTQAEEASLEPHERDTVVLQSVLKRMQKMAEQSTSDGKENKLKNKEKK